MTPTRRFLTSAFLLGLGVWDAVLAAIAIGFPGFWFASFHGAPYVDPQALLARTGAVWAAFALFQLVAFFKWTDVPIWLAVVGGMRLSETFADLTYLVRAQHVTHAGTLGLVLSTGTNIFLGIFFIRGCLELQPRERRPASRAPASPPPAGTTAAAGGAIRA